MLAARISEAVAPQQSWKERGCFGRILTREIDILQLEAVNILRDEATAISFCQMPPESRKLCVNRLQRIEEWFFFTVSVIC